MCSERRAVFQRVERDDSGRTRTSFSLTLTRAQAWATLLVTIGTLGAMLFGGWSWAKDSIENVAERVFSQELQKFHKDAQPAIEKIIDDKIERHRDQAEKPFSEKMHELDNRLTALETNTANLQDLARGNSAKLDRILERMAER